MSRFYFCLSVFVSLLLVCFFLSVCFNVLLKTLIYPDCKNRRQDYTLFQLRILVRPLSTNSISIIANKILQNTSILLNLLKENEHKDIPISLLNVDEKTHFELNKQTNADMT